MQGNNSLRRTCRKWNSVYNELSYRIAGYFSLVEIFVKSWERFPELNSLRNGVDRGWRNELWTWDTRSGYDEKRLNASWSSLAWEASLSSQAQPTPARIVFRILKLSAAGLVGSGLPKAICAGVVSLRAMNNVLTKWCIVLSINIGDWVLENHWRMVQVVWPW